MAKEAPRNFLGALKEAIKSGNPERLYFFHGQEQFLLQHYFRKLKNVVLDELTESFNFHSFNPENFHLQSFSEAVENLPMMANFTMVHLDDIDPFKMDEDSRNKMAEILSDIPDYCVVVFTYNTVAWNPDSRMKKLYAAVSAGQVVEFAKQNQRDLVAWVGRHFNAQKKQITPDLCLYLVEISDGTMTWLSGEIQKICAYSGSDKICKADIDAVTEPVLDVVIFHMTDQLGTGDYGAALLTLHKLIKMQEKPIPLLGAIGNHLRRISVARTLLSKGRGVDELMKIYPMLKEYPAKKCMQSAQRFSARFCEAAAALIAETDYKMKTSYDDPERLLELLILCLAQEARNG